jgi:hypothetical protein
MAHRIRHPFERRIEWNVVLVQLTSDAHRLACLAPLSPSEDWGLALHLGSMFSKQPDGTIVVGCDARNDEAYRRSREKTSTGAAGGFEGEFQSAAFPKANGAGMQAGPALQCAADSWHGQATTAELAGFRP